MKLETSRLVLRDWQDKDKSDLIEAINNVKVSKWLLVVPFPYKKKDAFWWIKHCKENIKEKPRKDYALAIELKKEKKVIGCVSLHHVDEFQGTAEIGYWLGQKYWRKGYISESISKILEFAFKKLKLRRIWAGVFATNIPSQKSLEKFGFKCEGKSRKSVRSKATKKIHDVHHYALLKEEKRLK